MCALDVAGSLRVPVLIAPRMGSDYVTHLMWKVLSSGMHARIESTDCIIVVLAMEAKCDIGDVACHDYTTIIRVPQELPDGNSRLRGAPQVGPVR